MKMVIEDLVCKMNGGTEIELPEGTTIRLDNGVRSLSIGFDTTNQSLVITKQNYQSDQLAVMPLSSNRILIS